MMGTLEYMAPEVLLRQGISQAADVYAWAISVNELATGVQPFSDCTKENPAVHTILDMNYGRCAADQTQPDLCIFDIDHWLADAESLEGLYPTPESCCCQWSTY